MNKFLLKIMLLSLIIPVYGRVLSPGVAKYKLDQLLKGVNDMRGEEKDQALRELAGPLQARYQKMLTNTQINRQGFKDFFLAISKIIDNEDMNEESLFELIDSLSERKKLNPEQIKELKSLGQAKLKEKMEKAEIEEKDEVPNLKEKLIDEKTIEKQKFSEFLQALKNYFVAQLEDIKDPTKVKNPKQLFTAEYGATLKHLDKNANNFVNDFFKELEAFNVTVRTWNPFAEVKFGLVQKAFTLSFFPLINLLITKEPESLEDLKSLKSIMDKGLIILNATVKGKIVAEVPFKDATTTLKSGKQFQDFIRHHENISNRINDLEKENK